MRQQRMPHPALHTRDCRSRIGSSRISRLINDSTMPLSMASMPSSPSNCLSICCSASSDRPPSSCDPLRMSCASSGIAGQRARGRTRTVACAIPQRSWHSQQAWRSSPPHFLLQEMECCRQRRRQQQQLRQRQQQRGVRKARAPSAAAGRASWRGSP